MSRCCGRPRCQKAASSTKSSPTILALLSSIVSRVRVRFTAIIGKDGRVEHLRFLDGHPLLVRAAREAARQWIYRTSFLGGEPVRVISILAVPFRIGPSMIP